MQLSEHPGFESRVQGLVWELLFLHNHTIIKVQLGPVLKISLF